MKKEKKKKFFANGKKKFSEEVSNLGNPRYIAI